MKFEVIGSSFNVAFLIKANTLEQARGKAKARMKYPQDHYAIYKIRNKKGRRFHSSADETFLIEHYNSIYWNNRGYESVGL
jgi:hypothetical protein